MGKQAIFIALNVNILKTVGLGDTFQSYY